MPRPEIPQEVLDQWEAEVTAAEQNMPSELTLAYANPQVRAKLHEISVAGKWLKAELLKAGLEDEKANKFCFAFGQRCFMAPDVWDLAVRTFEVFKKNQETMAAHAPPPYVTRDLPPDEARALYEKYTRVHGADDASTPERQADELRGDQGEVPVSDGGRGEGDPPLAVEGTE